MSAVDRLAKMPYWPGRMTAEPAAMYMGMSTGAFLQRYRQIAYEEGGNVYWSYRQLQSLIDEQFGFAPLSRAHDGTPRDTSWDDLSST